MRAIQTIPENCILLLEDIDHIFQERKRTMNIKMLLVPVVFYNDGFGSQYKLITMITTNFIDILIKHLFVEEELIK